MLKKGVLVRIDSAYKEHELLWVRASVQNKTIYRIVSPKEKGVLMEEVKGQDHFGAPIDALKYVKLYKECGQC